MKPGRALALLLLAACSKDTERRSDPGDAPAAADRRATPDTQAVPPASSSPPAAPTTAPAPSAAPMSTVKLLDAGREPRRALRYAFSREQTERMAIVLSTAVSADNGDSRRDITLAPVEIAIAIAPGAVSPDGDLRFAWHVESAGLGALDASSPPEVAQGWSAQLAPVAHLSGTATISSRGICRGLVLDAAGVGDAGPDAEMVVQVVQMVRDVAAPLPDEPVGPGARWQKLTTLEAKTGRATQTDTYTLTAVHGETGSLADVLVQTAFPQSLRAPGAAPGTGPARMDQLLTSGTARVRFDLARLIPQTTLEGTTSMALSAPSSRLNMVMHLGITVRGSVP